jgi:hypothetical protein
MTSSGSRTGLATLNFSRSHDRTLVLETSASVAGEAVTWLSAIATVRHQEGMIMEESHSIRVSMSSRDVPGSRRAMCQLTVDGKMPLVRTERQRHAWRPGVPAIGPTGS